MIKEGFCCDITQLFYGTVLKFKIFNTLIYMSSLTIQHKDDIISETKKIVMQSLCIFQLWLNNGQQPLHAENAFLHGYL